MQLREKYLKARKKEKTGILNEYIENTGHNRKYVISVLNTADCWEASNTVIKTRKKIYGQEIMTPLVLLWKIFDCPCGQRLEPCIKTELERLRSFGEINTSDEIAAKLKKISPATIDRKLKTIKSLEHKRHFSATRSGSLLKKKIPIRLTDWNTKKIGFLETDLVIHCGSSAFGHYASTVSLTEIATGWWEGEAIMGKGQKAVLEALKSMRQRTPFTWKGLDSDNGGEFINYPLWGYCNEEHIAFTRSRENKKNDNAYVEQKNWTHVRKLLGYFRYDTPEEIAIINDLYRNELRLYKNFFQPVMKLAKKTRVGAKRKRKYEPAKTPFQRLMDSNQIKKQIKEELKATYQKLNPAALKRAIDSKLDHLFHVYEAKHKAKTTVASEREEVLVRC